MTSLLQAIFNRNMLICIFTGFSSGLPLYVLISLVPAWLRTEGIGLKEIGLFALIGFPYTWKFIWSPLLDRYVPPFLGRRRGWMLISQLCLIVTLCLLGWIDPGSSLGLVALVTTLIAFCSANQDIVLDAYRRELLKDEELGLGNSIHINAYRISGLIPGSLSLILADHMAWEWVFSITALFMLPGILMTLFISELPAHAIPKTLRSSIIEPFKEFLTRHGFRQAVYVLAFMFLYKLGDSMATSLATPFYLDMGYTKTEIGLIAKNAALWPMIIGGLLGGIIMLKTGIYKALWGFGVVQLVSILGFAWLAQSEPDLWRLGLVISFEYLGVGLGTAAFTAYIAQVTHKAYAATQLALFTALTAVPRTFANAVTGLIVEQVGWTHFFLICTALAIPGMLLLFRIAASTKKLDHESYFS